jgi:hypothetical protein
MLGMDIVIKGLRKPGEQYATVVRVSALYPLPETGEYTVEDARRLAALINGIADKAEAAAKAITG